MMPAVTDQDARDDSHHSAAVRMGHDVTLIKGFLPSSVNLGFLPLFPYHSLSQLCSVLKVSSSFSISSMFLFFFLLLFVCLLLTFCKKIWRITCKLTC